jgi:hypothetical protein
MGCKQQHSCPLRTQAVSGTDPNANATQRSQEILKISTQYQALGASPYNILCKLQLGTKLTSIHTFHVDYNIE